MCAYPLKACCIEGNINRNLTGFSPPVKVERFTIKTGDKTTDNADCPADGKCCSTIRNNALIFKTQVRGCVTQC